jgi:hypothetical protein
VPLHGCAALALSTSSRMAVRVNEPPTPLYALVPEPATTGTCRVTATLPEQVAVSVGKLREMAYAKALSSAAISRRNVPRES